MGQSFNKNVEKTIWVKSSQGVEAFPVRINNSTTIGELKVEIMKIRPHAQYNPEELIFNDDHQNKIMVAELVETYVAANNSPDNPLKFVEPTIDDSGNVIS